MAQHRCKRNIGELSHIKDFIWCLDETKEEEERVAGIEKVERTGNREIWDNSEKHHQRKKRGHNHMIILLFHTLNKQAQKWSGLTHWAQEKKVIIEQLAKRDVKESGKFRKEKSNELRTAKRNNEKSPTDKLWIWC